MLIGIINYSLPSVCRRKQKLCCAELFKSTLAKKRHAPGRKDSSESYFLVGDKEAMAGKGLAVDLEVLTV